MDSEETNPRGRPTDYTPELAEIICQRVALRENINLISADESMPSQTTMYLWRKKYPEFSKKYLEACSERSHARADKIDDVTHKVENGELEPAAAAVILKAEMWQAGRENPKRYGDKTTLANDPDNPLPPATVTVVFKEPASKE